MYVDIFVNEERLFTGQLMYCTGRYVKQKMQKKNNTFY